MTNGTMIRTALFAIACVNQSIASVGDVDLGNETANLVYRIISLACTIITGAFALYYNNDFTPEAVTATIRMREAKEKRMWEQELTEEPEDSYVEEEEVIADEV